ncbi:hypothetical protein I3843_Q011300 [Carya illinoinensis]|uniref:lycopene beta-cyclase n=1 Tax=Carya illinoinensis TaxID=32201 RepID=A0A922DU70_CARIL|nr:hypothetical protein I3843_Q011300 [Carya illinoinensis]KAG6690925.1 hypothetical protein I3842_10G037200 [Carya illinoinensis]
MDTLLKTPNKLGFLYPFHGFSEKKSNSRSSKLQNQDFRFGPEKSHLKGVRKGFIKTSACALLELVPETKKENLNFELPMYDPSKGLVVDLAVVGGGPAGLAVAQQVSEAGLSVCTIDPSPKLIWPNNYGVWVDEFDAMDLLDCLDTTWSGAVVFTDDQSKKDLDRPYGRFHQAKVIKVIHEESKSLLICNDESRCLVQYDMPYNPGYQVAYGILAEVEEHPFDVDKMDISETSLVARPGVPMEDIQERMVARLKHLGIKVKGIEEDEHCVIPTGGPLPVLPQRVVGIGGTAGMVHPSTGYMVARTLAAAPIVANSIVQYIGSDRGLSGNELSSEVWKDLWPIERRRQREFFCFGMDILLKLDLPGTRRFFDAFFDLEPRYWHGFLSSRLFLPKLIFFGLSLFSHASNTSRLEIMAKGTVPLANMINNLIQDRN